MSVKVYDQQAKEVGTVSLPKEIFEVEINSDVLHQAIVTQEANSRVNRAHTKDRSEVRGGGKKPWRQKGTGRARHGSIRSPIWRGGGVTHGPRNEKIYAKKINKKVRRKALFMALTSKVRDKEFYVLDSFQFEQGKTRRVVEMFENFSGLAKDVRYPTFLVITPDRDMALINATKNIPYANTIGVKSLNPRDILKYKFLMMPKEAIKVIEEIYNRK